MYALGCERLYNRGKTNARPAELLLCGAGIYFKDAPAFWFSARMAPRHCG